MKDDLNEQLAEFLDQVPHDDLMQYFKDRNITPPDLTKKALIRFLMDSSDLKTDARAAAVLELRNSARALRSTITEATGKLQGVIDAVDGKRQSLSDELRKEVSGVRTLTQTYQIALGVITVVIGLVGLIGYSKFGDLDSKAAEASKKLDVAGGMIEAYRAHIERVALDDLDTVMNAASTRWFLESDKPVRSIVRSDRVLIAAAKKAPSGGATAESGLTFADALALQFDAIQHVLESGDTAKDYTAILKTWEGLETKVAAAPLRGNEDVRKRFLAYIKNVLGIAYYARFNVERNTANLDDFKSAEKKFREATEFDGQYSPAMSNLAVLLLDRIERTMKMPSDTEKKKLEEAFAEPEALLKRALNNEQPAKTTAKIFNNLACSALQRAILRGDLQDFEGALRNLDQALSWLERGLSKENPPPILAATKAEVVAYKAYATSMNGGNSGPLVADALKLLNEARARSYDFKVKTAGELFDLSPSLAKFVARFEDQRKGVLVAVGLMS